MSDQQETGAGVILDLEELFLSREFGRRPMHRTSPAVAAVESAPAQLEQVFLSEVFGHPEVVTAATRVVEEPAPAVSGRPGLVLLKGGGEGAVERDNAHYRAIAAVSGVAAAALAVAGLNAGTAPRPGRPPITEQAQGVPLSYGHTRVRRVESRPGWPRRTAQSPGALGRARSDIRHVRWRSHLRPAHLRRDACGGPDPSRDSRRRGCDRQRQRQRLPRRPVVARRRAPRRAATAVGARSPLPSR